MRLVRVLAVATKKGICRFLSSSLLTEKSANLFYSYPSADFCRWRASTPDSNGRSSWEVTEVWVLQSKIVGVGGWWLKIYFQRQSSDNDKDLRSKQQSHADKSPETPPTDRVPSSNEKRAVETALLKCGWRDSNPHASQHQILSLAWLPITPHPP